MKKVVCKECGEIEIHYCKGLCLTCYRKQYNKVQYQKHRVAHIEKMKKYYKDNKEAITEQRKIYVKKLNERKKLIENNDEIDNVVNKYEKENIREEIKQVVNKATPDSFAALLAKIRFTVLNNTGMVRKDIINILGASRDMVRACIETKFADGMLWENYGTWYLDVGLLLNDKGVSKTYDLSNLDETKECFNYKNLWPRWK